MKVIKGVMHKGVLYGIFHVKSASVPISNGEHGSMIRTLFP